MNRGKWFLALGLIILMAACTGKSSTTGSVPDSPENRLAAAKRYLAAVPPQEMLQSTGALMAQRLPEPTRKIFLKALADKDLLKKTYRICETALVKYFTPDELNAMTAFFGSKAGKSARTKFSPYMHDIMPQINTEMRTVFHKLQEQATKEGKKAGQPQAARPPAAPPKPGDVKPAPPASPKPKVEPPKAAPPQPEKPKSN